MAVSIYREEENDDYDEYMKTDEREDYCSGTETGATNADDGGVVELLLVTATT